jgi:hypothetical protein
MPDITYELGDVSFDAVPEDMTDRSRLPVHTDITLGRARLITTGVPNNTISLSGSYMAAETRDSILELFAQCCESGTTFEFNDGYQDRDVLIHSFETTPLIGATEGFSFKLDLIVIE